MLSGAPVTDEDIIGYTVAYEQEELQFPVYIVAMLAAAFIAAGIITEKHIFLLLALPPAAYAYYNFPLLETGRPRLGAGQYGLFVEGLGLIQWRAIDEMTVALTDTRGITGHELNILLKMPLSEALLIDWRNRPLARKIMRLPWSLKGKTTVRIPLDIMDRPVGDVHQTLLRMWRYYRGQ